MYNIVISKEDAIKFCNEIYPENCLSMDRKYIIAQSIKSWKRPYNMRRIDPRKRWNPEDDQFILQHAIEESMELFDISEKSVQMRLWRLKKQQSV